MGPRHAEVEHRVDVGRRLRGVKARKLAVVVCVVMVAVVACVERSGRRARADGDVWQLRVTVRGEHEQATADGSRRVYSLATVRLLDRERTCVGEQVVEENTCEFSGVAGEVGIVVLPHNWCAPQWIPWRGPDAEGKGHVLVELEPGLAVSGRVTDAKGRGAGGIRVQLRHAENPWWLRDAHGWVHTWEETTGSDGQFRVTGLLLGDYDVTVEVHPGRRGLLPPARPVRAAAGSEDVLLVCPMSAVVLVRFVNETTGKPVVSPVEWEMEDSEGELSAWGKMPSGRDGLRKQLPIGVRVSFKAKANGFHESGSFVVDVADTDTVHEVSVVLRPIERRGR